MGEFRMPSLGADMDVGTIVEWLVQPGDPVSRGQIVAVVDTAKAAIEIEAFETGVLERILVTPGTQVPVGTPLALIGAGMVGQVPEPAVPRGRLLGSLMGAEPTLEAPVGTARTSTGINAEPTLATPDATTGPSTGVGVGAAAPAGAPTTLTGASAGGGRDVAEAVATQPTPLEIEGSAEPAAPKRGSETVASQPTPLEIEGGAESAAPKRVTGIRAFTAEAGREPTSVRIPPGSEEIATAGRVTSLSRTPVGGTRATEPPRATPPVRHLAHQLGVDLSTLSGSGPSGQITRDDVLLAASPEAPTPTAAEQRSALLPTPPTAPAPAPAAPPEAPPPSPETPLTARELATAAPPTARPAASSEPSFTRAPAPATPTPALSPGSPTRPPASSAGSTHLPAGPQRASSPMPRSPEPMPSTGSPTALGSSGTRRRATPQARRIAAERGVDLDSVVGTGREGAIRAADVEQAAARLAVAQSAPTPSALRSPVVGPSAGETPTARSSAAAAPGDRKAAMRSAIASLMSRSNTEIPHYYVTQTIDLGHALTWLHAHNATLPPDRRLLPAVLFLRATVLAAQAVPDLNGHWVSGELRPAERIDLGVAIATRGGGLVTPAIADAADLPVDALMARLGDLVRRARRGTLKRAELAGASITVSSLGEGGPEALYGVIFPPQVALVGVGGIVDRPWAVDGMLTVRPTATVVLAADHRASDGRTASAFLAAFAHALDHPEEM